MSNSTYQDGTIIVKVNEKFSKEDAKKIITDYGLVVVHSFELINAFVVKVPVGEEMDWRITLEHDFDIEGVDLNFLTKPA